MKLPDTTTADLHRLASEMVASGNVLTFTVRGRGWAVPVTMHPQGHVTTSRPWATGLVVGGAPDAEREAVAACRAAIEWAWSRFRRAA